MKLRYATFQRPRGQPLLVFSTILGGWLVLRVLLWEAPFVEGARALGGALPSRQAALGPAPAAASAAVLPALPGDGDGSSGRLSESLGLTGRSPAAERRHHPAIAFTPDAVPPQAAGVSGNGIPPEGADRFSVAAASADADSLQPADGRTADLLRRPTSTARHWSGDAWLFLREASAAPLVAGRPAYGRSQAGAVLRYRLSPGSSHRPVLYARATRALTGAREGEIAAGLAARPVPALPVSVSAEVRVYDSAAGQEVRPAAFAVTELPPAELPFGLRGEAYAQVGYVGGSFATAFVDGQVRVERRAMRLGEQSELRIGGAVSGGAQKHAERLDAGPGATISFPLGEGYARLALDYRFRIAGDAEPGNGPALTFSAGF